jgi:transposase
VFLDEAGANLAMGRSHVWVKRGTEYVEPRPMNWGKNLTLIGAIRQRGRVTVGPQWTAATAQSFVTWVRRRLAPVPAAGGRRRAGQSARTQRSARPTHHRPPRARVRFLPPYSYDLNPIEAAWGLVKKRLRAFAPRTARPAPHGAGRTSRRHRASLSPVVHPCRVRQLKYYPGVKRTQSPERAECRRAQAEVPFTPRHMTTEVHDRTAATSGLRVPARLTTSQAAENPQIERNEVR